MDISVLSMTHSQKIDLYALSDPAAQAAILASIVDKKKFRASTPDQKRRMCEQALGVDVFGKSSHGIIYLLDFLLLRRKRGFGHVVVKEGQALFDLPCFY